LNLGRLVAKRRDLPKPKAIQIIPTPSAIKTDEAPNEP